MILGPGLAWASRMGRAELQVGRESGARGFRLLGRVCKGLAATVGAGQASRAISTARLSTLRCLHLPPIDVLVSNGPSESLRSGSARLGGGFPLRCFQRFSRPDVATRRCRWRDSRHTRGRFVPVLSY